jgi:hypothetical protein
VCLLVHGSRKASRVTRAPACYETGKICANDDISRALTDSGQLPVSLGCVSDSAVYDITAAVNDSDGAIDNALNDRRQV